MEKYRSTADLSTGVHPFIPSADNTGLGSRLVCAICLLPARCCAVVIGVALASGGCLIAVVIGVLSRAMGRACVRISHRLGLRFVLFGFGVWKYSSPTLERPRSRACVIDSPPGHGDLIVCNHSSYLDPIYLSCTYSPVFVQATAGGSLVQISLWKAVLLASTGVADKKDHEIGPAVGSLANVAAFSAKRRNGPTVIFAEGTTTNGAGVLRFPFLQFGKARVFALGLRYSPSRAESFTVGSVLLHALRRLTSRGSEIKGRIAGVAPDADAQRAVADLAGIPALRVGAEARVRFERHLADTADGY